MKTAEQIRVSKYRSEMRTYALERRLILMEGWIWSTPEEMKEHAASYLQHAKDYRDMAARVTASGPDIF